MNAPQIIDLNTHPILKVEEISLEMHPLVEHFYRDNGYKFRCGRQERLFVVRYYQDTIKQHIIAAARLVPRQQGAYWLRNMLVTKEKRNSGVGSYFMREILAGIAPGGCYCFALFQVVDFYQRLGFSIGTPDQCPPDIAAEYRKYKSRGRDWVLMLANSTPDQTGH
jgi:N-acetylglutamate synthase-like GNAT family acetyltransferase